VGYNKGVKAVCGHIQKHNLYGLEYLAIKNQPIPVSTLNVQ